MSRTMSSAVGANFPIEREQRKLACFAEREESRRSQYAETVDPSFQLCNTRIVLNRIPFEELEALVNETLPDDVGCIDIEDPSRGRPSDDQV